MSKKGLSIVMWAFVVVVLFSSPALAQQTVADLKYAEMAHYSWMRLASIVPEITDRVILPVGTIEAHGATCIGSDTYIPINLAKLAAKKCNALIAPAITHGATGLNIAQLSRMIEATMLLPLKEGFFDSQDISMGKMYARLFAFGLKIGDMTEYVAFCQKMVDLEMAIRRRLTHHLPYNEDAARTIELVKSARMMRAYILERLFQRRVAAMTDLKEEKKNE